MLPELELVRQRYQAVLEVLEGRRERCGPAGPRWPARPCTCGSDAMRPTGGPGWPARARGSCRARTR
jgi:hypothetical protein